MRPDSLEYRSSVTVATVLLSEALWFALRQEGTSRSQGNSRVYRELRAAWIKVPFRLCIRASRELKYSQRISLETMTALSRRLPCGCQAKVRQLITPEPRYTKKKSNFISDPTTLLYNSFSRSHFDQLVSDFHWKSVVFILWHLLKKEYHAVQLSFIHLFQCDAWLLITRTWQHDYRTSRQLEFKKNDKILRYNTIQRTCCCKSYNRQK